MSVDTESRARSVGRGAHVPAYGPVESILTYVLFFIVIDRATPTFRVVLSDVIPGISPGDVGFALAAFIWFVLVVSIIDQSRRQAAALGLGRHRSVDRDRSKAAVPSESRFLLSLVGAIVGAIVAYWTFESAMEMAIATIEIVFYLDVGGFDVAAFAVMVLFFVAWGPVTWTVDRLVIGGIRAVLAG